jgi:peptidoglycan hydrolase CwlO-like protein
MALMDSQIKATYNPINTCEVEFIKYDYKTHELTIKAVGYLQIDMQDPLIVREYQITDILNELSKLQHEIKKRQENVEALNEQKGDLILENMANKKEIEALKITIAKQKVTIKKLKS